jgi:SAM-dependent methyltransferase
MISNIKTLVEDLNVSRLIADDDFMFRNGDFEHYFSVGRSALRLIMACLTATIEYQAPIADVTSILDFGCGYGRVCRYLRAAFPAAEISVTDVNAAAVQFCVQTFNAAEVGLVPPTESYDLIWVGSVLTHLSEPVARDLLYTLANSLRPNGILVFTTHGRYSHAMHYCNPHKQFYLPGRIQNDRISAGYLSSGYGFSGHAYHSELMSLIDPGISIIDPSWVQRVLYASTGLMQIFFQERGWDFHQDVYGFARRELLQGP